MATRGKMGDGDRRFAELFKAAREARGMTQAQVMDAMNEMGFGFVQQTVYKIENHMRRVTIGEAIALAGIVALSLKQLDPVSADDPGELFRLIAERDWVRAQVERMLYAADAERQRLGEAQSRLHDLAARIDHLQAARRVTYVDRSHESDDVFEREVLRYFDHVSST